LSGENLEMGVVTEEILLGWLERLIFFIFGIVPIGKREKMVGRELFLFSFLGGNAVTYLLTIPTDTTKN